MKIATFLSKSLLLAPLSFRSSPRTQTFLVAAATILLALSVPGTTFAGSATWLSVPATNDWNTAVNWTAGGPPNAPADTAIFATSTRTAVSISANTEVNSIVFNAAASAFTITSPSPLTLTISGTGITNNSGITQKFVITAGGDGSHAFITFTNSATAGSSTTFTNNGSLVPGLFSSGNTIFNNTSTASSGTFNNNGGTVNGANGGATEFEDVSTAADATFNNNGGVASGAFGGFTSFSQFSNNISSAASGTFNNKSGAVSGANGGQAAFFSSSTAANGIFTNDGSAFSGAGEGFVQFQGTSTAGNGTFTNKSGTVSGADGGGTFFFNGSTAGDGTFISNGAASGSAFGGFVNFFNTSTAANGIFTNNGSAVNGPGQGFTAFFDTATAGDGTFTNNGGTVSGARGGVTQFVSNSTAGAATLIATGGAGGSEGEGGIIFFEDNSTGGTASVEVSGGSLDISRHNTLGVTIGSIEGSGKVFLGANKLTVGSNNLSTTLAGVIQDGGFGGGTGGSLGKTGSGTLSLTNSNTYTGGTSINAGKLIAAHDGALGSGNVSLTASGAMLTLQSGATNNYISDASTISIVNGATADLDFTGASDRVGGIVLNGVIQTAAGTYGSASSGATFQSAFFSGTGTLVLGGTPTPTPQLLNISTRLRVETGDNVMIGGFIVTGSAPKTVIIRAIGPSLPVPDKLANPTLEIFGPSGLIASNDDWMDAPNKQEIIDSNLAPTNDLESAVLATLPGGTTAYTAIVRGAGEGTGVGLVEVYDLNATDASELANISTRGFIQTGDNIMIGGFILGGGAGDATVLVRAVGPSLAPGVSDALADPTLEIRDINGALVSSNDNWQETQQAEIEETGLAPQNELESAVLETLLPGAYTAIVAGQDGGTGVGLVEVYRLP